MFFCLYAPQDINCKDLHIIYLIEPVSRSRIAGQGRIIATIRYPHLKKTCPNVSKKIFQRKYFYAASFSVENIPVILFIARL